MHSYSVRIKIYICVSAYAYARIYANLENAYIRSLFLYTHTDNSFLLCTSYLSVELIYTTFLETLKLGTRTRNAYT